MVKIKIKKEDWQTFFDRETERLFRKRGVILDIGGGHPYQKELESITRKHRAVYISLDYVLSTQPHIVGDGHLLPIRTKTVDTVILKSVLEHVANPFKIMDEVYRVLKPGGVLLLWVPFLFPYHAAPRYKDYYRFSQDGIVEILRDFSQLTLIPTRGYCETLINLLPTGVSQWLKYPAILLDRLYPVKQQHSGFGALAAK